MPRGDKSAYTDKQKRQAEHIEEGYEKRGVPEDEAARRAWATVNKMTGGGKKSGAGRGKKINTAPAKKGGHKGGAASAARSFAEPSASAKKAAQTRNAVPLPRTVDGAVSPEPTAVLVQLSNPLDGENLCQQRSDETRCVVWL
jgi:plasmid stabilization system protein ParE